MMNRRKLLLSATPALIATPAVAAMGIPFSLPAPALIAAPATAAAEIPVTLPTSAPAPHERIEAAMAEIRDALAEIYPGCEISSRVNLRDGSGGLALGAYPLKGYEVRYFFCDDPESWSPAVSTRDE
ncbi:hypothetical protein [Ancylobacter sp. FA202]|uniref:hypothetical protein n=1 Tax=Ancylobacter sp. FA202 TaxID=1111106 RepID=UPI00037042C0|nr:hypothetical protein [Ancylobacter sp. FA202]